MNPDRTILTDEQWERIRPLLPAYRGPIGKQGRDHRLFIEAILHRYRTGMPWRDLPPQFGDFRVVHRRFSRWSQRGLWEQIFAHLSQDADREYLMLDATLVRAHQHSAGAAQKGETYRRRMSPSVGVPGDTARKSML